MSWSPEARFTVYINFNTIVMSFQYRNAQGDYVFNENPLQNYIDFFRDISNPYSNFPQMIENSLMYFIVNDFVIVPLSVVLCYFLYKKVFLHQVFRVEEMEKQMQEQLEEIIEEEVDKMIEDVVVEEVEKPKKKRTTKKLS